MESSAQQKDSDAQAMDAVRALIVGGDDEQIEKVVRRNAKGMVSEVVSEALNEREAHDGSVNRVLVPLVEKSLHRSIEANSDKIVGVLYPLVGSLIRKAVAAFLVEFVERTNALIENSLSARSVKWRFEAWRAGISYADYVATKIYQYQIHQVFIIHRETGTLLNSAASDPSRSKDGDLISSMLVAMNDFVADAFGSGSAEADTDLDEIRTDDFTLIIKVGPQAILVAAVTGTIPPDVRGKLQVVLEDFHRYYQTPLLEYTGNTEPFLASETLLHECLVSARREPQKKKKKFGVGAVLLVCAIGFLGYLIFFRMQLSLLMSELKQAQSPAGIAVLDTRVDSGEVVLSLLRDEDAMGVSDWLAGLGVDVEKIRVISQPYLSLEKDLIVARISRLVKEYSSLNLQQTPELKLSGSVTAGTWRRFKQALMLVPGAADYNIDTTDVMVNVPSAPDQQTTLTYSAHALIAELSALSVHFDVNETTLTASALTTIEHIAESFITLQNISIELNASLDLFIIGVSDNSGSAVKNAQLSEKRAQAVKQVLVEAGVNEESLHTKGLGQMQLSQDHASRMVFLHVLLLQSEENKGTTP